MARKSIVDSTGYQAILDAEDNFIEIYADIADLVVGTGCPVSSNDTTPGYLDGKLLAGTGITLTEGNDGGDETLTIASSVSPSLAFVSANDTTAGYLNGKLVAGSGVNFVEGNDGGDETLTISATASGIEVSSNDTTPGYLNGKLVAGTGITLTENNDGGNETLTVDAVGAGIEVSSNDTTPGYLNGKLVAGIAVSVDGGDDPRRDLLLRHLDPAGLHRGQGHRGDLRLELRDRPGLPARPQRCPGRAEHLLPRRRGHPEPTVLPAVRVRAGLPVPRSCR